MRERLERDRERVGEGRAAGHHNLPDQILKVAPKAKAVRAAATRPAFWKERLERDRERVGERRAVAGHHNLPDQILKAAPKAKAVRAAATRPAVRRNMVIGFLNHNNIRKLQEAFAVEVDE
ncbi:hypothetical protein DIPPA_14810 [Diplonema papillatum]|nr:hypothetical protein DIPPA_14810 [Diplonema papillatum]